MPLVSEANELRLLREIIEKVANDVMTDSGTKLEYLIGTMIEIPRAALTANEVSRHADFFSFGTNDLT